MKNFNKYRPFTSKGEKKYCKSRFNKKLRPKIQKKKMKNMKEKQKAFN